MNITKKDRDMAIIIACDTRPRGDDGRNDWVMIEFLKTQASRLRRHMAETAAAAAAGRVTQQPPRKPKALVSVPTRASSCVPSVRQLPVPAARRLPAAKNVSRG